MDNQVQPQQQTVLFPEIGADVEPTVIESMCMSCGKNGKTTLLLTKIPFFQEVVVVSFSCDECGFKNSELQPAGQLKDHGLEITLKCTKESDLNRDVIKSEHCSMKIPEISLEIPAARSKGSLSTIEGLLSSVIDDLEETQDERRQKNNETADKIDSFLVKIKKLRDGLIIPFTVQLRDPSGNSFIKNPFAPSDDPNLKTIKFNRNVEDLKNMGFNPEESDGTQKDMEEQMKKKVEKDLKNYSAHRMDFSKPLEDNALSEEAVVFKVPCHNCQKEGETKMCSVSIPYFKELIIMAFSCDFCGAKSREVKPGGAVSDKAKKITMPVEDEDDLKRFLFKSETCRMVVPEIDLELTMGTLGGVYTTIEGLIEKVYDNMKENNPFVGDSSDQQVKGKLEAFYKDLESLQKLKKKWTLILDDPLDNSFIQNPDHPKPDPKVKVEIYDRTHDQNEELGINDMKVENY